MNAADIKANPTALAAATAGDWSACVAAMRAVSVTAEPRLCFSVETSLAILAVGGDPNQIMTAMDGDATGKFLLTKLATVGVMWAHPLTAAYLDAAVAANGLGQASRDAAVNLSAPTSFPYSEVTADECLVAWDADITFELRGQVRIRLDSILNQIGTSEQADGIADLRAIADELEAA